MPPSPLGNAKVALNVDFLKKINTIVKKTKAIATHQIHSQWPTKGSIHFEQSSFLLCQI